MGGLNLEQRNGLDISVQISINERRFCVTRTNPDFSKWRIDFRQEFFGITKTAAKDSAEPQ
jgi:hypothetical protein